jgi:hypothetical protein
MMMPENNKIGARRSLFTDRFVSRVCVWVAEKSYSELYYDHCMRYITNSVSDRQQNIFFEI